MTRLFFFPLLLLVVATNAFIVVPTSVGIRSTTSASSVSAATVLQAVKKKNDGKPETKKITDPFQLVVLYMTPWKNPNSIFVYMFAVVYALGKMSEARHMAGQ